MPRSFSNSPSDSDQNQPHDDADSPPRYSEQFPLLPALTSDEAGWSSVSLEYYHHLQPAGETPKLCFDHYAIAVTLGRGCQLDWQIEGVAKGQVQRQMLFHGGMSLVPMHHVHWGAWNQQHGSSHSAKLFSPQPSICSLFGWLVSHAVKTGDGLYQ